MEKFAFILHPLDKSWVTKKYKIAALLPSRVVEAFLKYKASEVLSHITGVRSITGTEAEGWLVACPLTSRQMMELDTGFVLNKIIEAGRLAESLGAKIVGLAAFTKIVADAGKTVSEALSIPTTTGNSYTVATAIEATYAAAERMEIKLNQAKIAIVGAAGSIGSACAQMLSRNSKSLLLIDKNETRLQALSGELLNQGAKVEIASAVNSGIREADVIITVTSATTPILDAKDLKPGAVVCDVARPRNVARSVARERDDVLVIEGGVVEVPGEVDFGFDFGFPPKHTFACMAEPIILALEKRYESYTIGREISVSQVEEINRMAKKHGFKLSGFRSFDKPLSDEEIEKIKLNASRRKFR